MDSFANRNRDPQIRLLPGAWVWTSRVLIVIMLVSLVMFVASVFLRPADEVLLWADLGLYSVPMLVAAILAMVRGLSGDQVMRPWIAVSVALFIYVIGNVLYSFTDALSLPDVVPPIPDMFWLAFYPVTFLGVLLLTKRRLSGTSN